MERSQPTMNLSYFLLPKEEHNSAHVLNLNLYALDDYAADLEAAIDLFEFRDPRVSASAAKAKALREAVKRGENVPSNSFRAAHSEHSRAWQRELRWHIMAARSGVFAIFHFAKILDAIRESNLVSCPTLTAMTDIRQLRIAAKIMKSKFPQFARMRHAIGHEAENMATTANLQQHASPRGFYQSSNISSDGTVDVTYNGKHIRERILARSTLETVRSVQQHAYRAFDHAQHQMDLMLFVNPHVYPFSWVKDRLKPPGDTHKVESAVYYGSVGGVLPLLAHPDRSAARRDRVL